MLGKDDLITALTKTLDFSNVNCIATIWTLFVKRDMIPKRKVQLYEEGTLLKHSQGTLGNNKRQEAHFKTKIGWCPRSCDKMLMLVGPVPV